MNLGPQIRSPEALHSARAVSKHLGVEENRAQLLELRTESGLIYVCPSRWQRIRLLWTFRHFHILPSQVLSRRDQRLIERLSRSALVTPPLPVARDAVFGVVEKVSTRSTKPARRVVTRRTKRARPSTLQAKPDIPDLPRPGLSDHETFFFEEPGPRYLPAVNSSGSISVHEAVATMYGATDGGSGEGFQQWGALGMLVAVCIVVILARVYGDTLLARPGQMRKPPTISAPIAQAAIRVSPPTGPLPSVEKPTHRVKPLQPEPKLVARESAPLASDSEQSTIDSSTAPAPIESAPTAPTGDSERLFVSQPSQGHFVEPVVSDPNLDGELQLRALIGADGSVKEVTVLSGDPKLAEAGMRAIRRRHYSQYRAPGRPGEGETLIRVRFFGQDAVSITPAFR